MNPSPCFCQKLPRKICADFFCHSQKPSQSKQSPNGQKFARFGHPAMPTVTELNNARIFPIANSG
jgi:hypothetical protein